MYYFVTVEAQAKKYCDVLFQSWEKEEEGAEQFKQNSVRQVFLPCFLFDFSKEMSVFDMIPTDISFDVVRKHAFCYPTMG